MLMYTKKGHAHLQQCIQIKMHPLLMWFFQRETSNHLIRKHFKPALCGVSQPKKTPNCQSKKKNQLAYSQTQLFRTINKPPAKFRPQVKFPRGLVVWSVHSFPPKSAPTDLRDTVRGRLPVVPPSHWQLSGCVGFSARKSPEGGVWRLPASHAADKWDQITAQRTEGDKSTVPTVSFTSPGRSPCVILRQDPPLLS